MPSLAEALQNCLQPVQPNTALLSACSPAHRDHKGGKGLWAQREGCGKSVGGGRALQPSCWSCTVPLPVVSWLCPAGGTSHREGSTGACCALTHRERLHAALRVPSAPTPHEKPWHLAEVCTPSTPLLPCPQASLRGCSQGRPIPALPSLAAALQTCLLIGKCWITASFCWQMRGC